MKNNLRVVAGKDELSPLLQPQSLARIKLAQLINDKLTIEDKLRGLAEAAGKLREAQDAEGNAAAAVNALDAEETRAMAAWSQNASGPMPIFDQTRRQKLRAAVDAAAAQGAAARKAAAVNGAEQQRENTALKALEPQFAVAIAEVIAESVEPLLQDFEAANKALAAKAARIQEALATITDIGHAVGNPAAARPAFIVMEKLHEKVRAVSGRPAPDGENHRAVWSALAAKLRSDPLARLD